MKNEIILSGFGGQGVMLMGQMLTQAGLLERKCVSWIPSYGPEMRGGTAYCSVIISDEEIGSPVVVKPTVLVAMNLPSLHRFEESLVSGGTLVINKSLSPDVSDRKDITQFAVPMNELADEMGNPRVLNFVGLGVILAAISVVSEESLFAAAGKIFGSKFSENPEMLKLNKDAFHKGYDYVKNLQ